MNLQKKTKTENKPLPNASKKNMRWFNIKMEQCISSINEIKGISCLNISNIKMSIQFKQQLLSKNFFKMPPLHWLAAVVRSCTHTHSHLGLYNIYVFTYIHTYIYICIYIHIQFHLNWDKESIDHCLLFLKIVQIIAINIWVEIWNNIQK